MNTLRLLLSMLLSIVALAMLALGTAAPFLMREDVARNQRIHAQFERTATFAEAHRRQYGRLPDSPVLREWAARQGFQEIGTVSVVPIGCPPGFFREAGDQLVLEYWRGESLECFAWPSARATLNLSLSAMLMSWAGLFVLILLVLGGLLGWCAWRLFPGWRLPGDPA